MLNQMHPNIPPIDLTSEMPFSIFPIADDDGDAPPPEAPGLDDESGLGFHTKGRAMP
jgi:hypothetical protein